MKSNAVIKLMNELIIIISIFAVLLTGLIKILFDRHRMYKNHNIVADYLEEFNKYIEAGGKDSERYAKLLFSADKIQHLLGSYGICEFKPPFANYIIKRYQIILNTIPEIKKEFDNELFTSSSILTQYVDLVTQSLIRFGGATSRFLDEYNSEIKNPLIWFREGIRFIITLPIELLKQFGLLSSNASSKLKSSYIIKFISALVTIVSFLSGFIGIILGWDEFLKIIESIF